MRSLSACLLLFALQTATPASPPAATEMSPRYLRYRRLVALPGSASAHSAPTPATVCAVLDASVFEHSLQHLGDLRLLDPREIPYVLTISETPATPPEPALISQVILHGETLIATLHMPTGPSGHTLPYTALLLDLQAKDFVATVRVTGLSANGHPTPLPGTVIFDLSSQGLARSTAVPLPESTFPELRLELSWHALPGSAVTHPPASLLRSVSVPPARQAQVLYEPAAQTTSFVHRGSTLLATLRLPAHVPVERVTFTLAPGQHGSFRHAVHITANTIRSGSDHGFNPPEVLSGEISQTLLPAHGGLPERGSLPEIDHRSLSLPALLGANLREPATVEFAIDEDPKHPLHLQAITLEMRQRQICFPVPSGAQPLVLYYGDSALDAPRYDFAAQYHPLSGPSQARLGPEQPNPLFLTRPVPRGFLEGRHPELLWLLAADVLGGAIFLLVQLTRQRRRHPPKLG